MNTAISGSTSTAAPFIVLTAAYRPAVNATTDSSQSCRVQCSPSPSTV